MTELPSNDYISQINQNGSGLNIPQIVNAIVDAEITPVRAPVVKQQEQVAASISGLSELKASAELTNQNIANLKSTDVSISTRSSDTDVLTVAVTDQSELQVGVSKITAISQLAQAHSHSIPAVGSNPATFGSADAGLPEDYRLKIRLGTYNLTGGAQTFTPNGTDPDIPIIQFSAGESITAVAVKLDQIEGINAKVVNTTGSNYKIMITGETGLDNAFEIQTLPLTFNHTNIVGGQQYTIVDNVTTSHRANAIQNGQVYQVISTDGPVELATGMINNAEYKIVSSNAAANSNASAMDSGRWYRVVSQDSGVQSDATAITNNSWYRIVNTDDGSVTSDGSFVNGRTYKITSSGTTDFTAFSNAANNNVGTVFTANANAQGSGGGQAKEFTDYVNMFGAADNNPNTEFKATISNSPPPSGTGKVIKFTNFNDYAAGNGHNGVGHEFKANVDGAGFTLTGPGRVIAFTNYQVDFGAADNSAGTIFTANTDVDAGTGPGTVKSYTDFVDLYGAGNNTNAIFTAGIAGTAVHGKGTVGRYTDYTKYGAGNSNAGTTFTANQNANATFGSGTVTMVSEDVSGNNNYRIFDTWSDYRDVNSLRAQDLSAQDIIFDLNGLEVKRETNIVTDVVPGASFEILKTSTVGAEIITGADKESLMLTVQSFIDELNAYRADLKALSRSDRTGGDLGKLYGNPYVKSRLRSLSEFMLKPIKGYTTFPETANSAVYLSQLGFKTQKDGTYGLDQKAFDTTFNNAPGNFDALTKDHALSKHPEISVVWDPGADLEAGIYQFHHDDGIGGGGDGSGNVIYAGALNGGGARLYRAADGGGSFSYDGTNVNSTGDFPGLFLRTTSNNLGDDVPMNVHLGRSFATLFAEFHDEVLNDRYVHRRQVQNIEIQNEMLLDRIARLDLRSDNLAQSYNAEFQMMEDMVTSFKSTGDYLTNVVDAWNK
ncbi:flagellar filament capping protein FliD [Planktomarina sp.]|nr:flagellar filament capping protein FliD [Planktomarina sp.]